MQSELPRVLAQTEMYRDWAKCLEKKVAASDIGAGSAKQYRAEGLHFFAFVLRSQMTAEELHRCLDAGDPAARVDRALRSALSKIDLETIVSHLKEVGNDHGRDAVNHSRSVLVVHLLPWLQRTAVTDFDVKKFSRRDFRLESSIDDHIARKNEFVQRWSKAMETEDALSADVQANYRRMAWRYCRYLRNNYLDKAAQSAIQSGELHPARALNDLITKDPFVRVQAFLKQFDGALGDAMRSVILNHFYRYLNDQRLTRFNPETYAAGTFYPDLPRTERIVRESPILSAWREHVMADKGLLEESGENYVRIVARYLAFVRDTLVTKPDRQGEVRFRPNVRKPEKTFDHLVRRTGCEQRLARFLDTLESDRTLASARWLLAERFYGWMESYKGGCQFNRERFDRLMTA